MSLNLKNKKRLLKAQLDHCLKCYQRENSVSEYQFRLIWPFLDFPSAKHTIWFFHRFPGNDVPMGTDSTLCAATLKVNLIHLLGSGFS